MAATTSGPKQTALKKKIKINPKGPLRKVRSRTRKQQNQLNKIFYEKHGDTKYD